MPVKFGMMNEPRRLHTVSQLSNWTFLVAGGNGVGYLNSAEVYDSTTGTWTYVGAMNKARSQHTATVLDDGTGACRWWI